MKALSLILISLFLVINLNAETKVIEREGEPDFIQTNDEKVTLAITEAKSKTEDFIKLIKEAKSFKGFFIKRGFKYGDKKSNYEHIWLSLKGYESGVFTAIVSNEPVFVKNLKLGQEVKIKKDEISDWMLASQKGLIGGYTIVALVYGTKDQESYEKSLKIDWSKYDFLKKFKKAK